MTSERIALGRPDTQVNERKHVPKPSRKHGKICNAAAGKGGIKLRSSGRGFPVRGIYIIELFSIECRVVIRA